jgi:hypothetical protein
MAERVPNALYSQVKDLNRLRDRKIQGMATGLVPTFAAQRAGGPLMAQQVAASFQPQVGTGGMAPEDKLSMKADVLAKFNENRNKLRSDYLGRADKLMAAKSNIDKAIELALEASGLDATARNETMKSINTGMAQITQNANDNARAMVVGMSTVNAGAIKSALEDVRAAIQGQEAVAVLGDPGVTQKIADQLVALKASGDPATIASFIVQANEIMQANTKTDLSDMLKKQVDLQGPGSAAAKMALDIVQDPSAQQILTDANDVAVKYVAANSAAAIEGLRGSSYAPEKVIDLLAQILNDERLQGIFTGEEDPTKALATLEELFKNAPGAKPSDLAAWDKLLEEIDNQDLPPTTSLYEARKRIFDSEEFQQFKQANGIPDDGQALKQLRRNVRDQRFSDRQIGRDNIRRKRQGLPLAPVPDQQPQAAPPSGDAGAGVQTPAAYTAPPKLKPTLGMSLSEVGNAVTRPANTIRTAGDAIQDILKKKKTPPKNEADDLEEQKL